MKFFVMKLSHDSGITIMKANGSTKKSALKSVMKSEGCPRGAISKVHEVTQDHFNSPVGAAAIHKIYDVNNVKIYVVNKMAVNVLGYVGDSVRVEYVETKQQCTVNRRMLSWFIPSLKKKIKRSAPKGNAGLFDQ